MCETLMVVKIVKHLCSSSYFEVRQLEKYAY